MGNKADWAVIGLGNPGKRYEGNRHNIGWMVAAALVERHKGKISKLSPIYYGSEINISGSSAIVILPTTYMNQSGEAVRKVMERYQVLVDRVIVICDEYNFPTGKIHLKQSGSDGGHNGVQSIIEEVGGTGFFRLRCGISRTFGEGGLVDYVLSDFPEDEEEVRDGMIQKAADAIEFLIRQGKSKAMSAINSGALWNQQPEKSEEKDKKDAPPEN